MWVYNNIHPILSPGIGGIVQLTSLYCLLEWSQVASARAHLGC